MTDLIASRYEIRRPLGKGGMGEVYQVWDIHLQKLWAMKVVAMPTGGESEIGLRQLEAEVHTLKQLNHPMLPTVVDVIQTQSGLCMIMEYIEGITLEAYLAQKKSLPQEEVIRIGIKLAEVLSYLHMQRPPLVYGDLKPANIMIKADGSLKLFDFGTVMQCHMGQMQERLCFGTYGYAPPEQLRGCAQLDKRFDIYALGATLYHMVTGQNPSKPPFRMQPIRAVNAGLSEGLEFIISRCTHPQMKHRFSTCEVCAEMLNNYKQLGKRRFFLKRIFLAVSAGLLLGGIVLAVQGAEREGAALFLSGMFSLGVHLMIKKAANSKNCRQSFILLREENLVLTEKKTPGL